jgi:hypothetical protein
MEAARRKTKVEGKHENFELDIFYEELETW